MLEPRKDITSQPHAAGEIPPQDRTGDQENWWDRLRSGVTELLFPSEQAAQHSSADYFAALLKGQSTNGSSSPAHGELIVRPAAPIYHTSLFEILTHGYVPLSTAELIAERMKAFALEGDAALFHGNRIADLWSMPFSTCDMVAHLGHKLKIIPTGYFVEKLAARQADPEPENRPLGAAHSVYSISKEEFERVPGEEFDFDNSHYCYAVSENQELALKIWQALAGEYFEPYRELMLKLQNKTSMEVWFAANPLVNSDSVALVRPWHLGAAAEGSKLESLHPALEAPLYERSYFVARAGARTRSISGQ